MTDVELETLVLELADYPDETEWLEFKENNATPDEIGEYISALANSAALLGKSRGYVVWGIQNVSHEVVGTTFRPRNVNVGSEDLEPWLARLLTPRIQFRFHEGTVRGMPVVLLEIHPATHTPIRFKTDEYIRVGSYKKKLREHSEKERVLWQTFSRTPFETGIACDSVAPDDVIQLILGYSPGQQHCPRAGMWKRVAGLEGAWVRHLSAVPLPQLDAGGQHIPSSPPEGRYAGMGRVRAVGEPRAG